VRGALREGRTRLAAATEEAALESELLLRHALGLGRVQLYQRLSERLTRQQFAAFRALVERRLADEPTSYITGNREFFGLDFEVTPAAIVPRPETETLVELVTAFARERYGDAPFTLVDVGTGCGAIAVSVAHALPGARVLANDISCAAVALARRNAARHRVAGRVELVEGDALGWLRSPSTRSAADAVRAVRANGEDEPGRRVDLIAANLPYVRTSDWERLPPEIRDHEPRTGLDGGPDGLRVIARLLAQLPECLAPGGALFAEIGDDQGKAAAALARGAFPEGDIRIERDLAGRDRVLVVHT
jgi:release factor glutamine methyltransferase